MRKTYEIPSVIVTQLMPDMMILAGSPVVISSGGGTGDISIGGPVIGN